MPEKGQVWDGVNRSGEVICDALIEHVAITSKTDHTAVVTASVPVEFIYDFVTVRVKQ